MTIEILAWATANLVFSLVPWGIVQLALLWQPPNRRNRKYRRAFMLTTAALAFGLTCLAFPPVGLIFPWVVAVIGAVVLDVKWYRYAHSPEGIAAIESFRFWEAVENAGPGKAGPTHSPISPDSFGG